MDYQKNMTKLFTILKQKTCFFINKKHPETITQTEPHTYIMFLDECILAVLKQLHLSSTYNKKMKKYSLLLFISCLVAVSQSVTAPINALGTTLPSLTSNLNYRVFNDLMKQSQPMVPYQQYGSKVNRYWASPLNFTNGLAHAYPASLPTNIYGMSEIKFYPEDGDLVNKTFNVQFQGSGTVGVYQSYPGGSSNVTWASGSGGSFVLKSVAQSLHVYVYFTTPANPVNSISIVLASLGTNYPTFTSNFIKYLQPFNLIRTCFWQGQNVYNSGIPKQIWANRTTKASSTQISSSGVALEHILELEALGLTLWPCIPDTADTDYITQMATLFASKRTQSNIMYLQFGNAFTIMNDFPDRIVTVPFDTFMQAYGMTYRNKILFTINYRDIQYYINAVGMRTSPPINFTYIDAIGAEASFGILDATVGYGLSDSDLKKTIINAELTYETTLNTAFQFAKRNGTNLVMFSGGPYLKVPAYVWNFRYSQNYSNQTLKTLADQESSLQSTLVNLTLNDPWVPELYLHWIARLKSMGVTTFMFSQLVGIFSNTTNIVPLLSNLNSTTQHYRALRDYILNGRTTILPTSGVVPPNPFTCSPTCVWGDCVYNICQCYAGYSGSDCSVYTAPNTQNKVGMNLQGVSYWTTQHPFIDMHREGSGWVYFVANGGWSSGEAFKDQVTFDANGYPTYLPPAVQVGTLIARDVFTHYDNGTYVVLYDGDGILQFGMYDVPAVRYGIGRVEIDVVPSTNLNNGILVTIARTNPNNYIRNIRVIRPGFEGIWQAVNFSPLMLEKLQPFGTLRFMDWTNTNGQTDSAWENRTLMSHRTYTKNGVAWEETIRLANTLGKNIWINIPHLATDDYVTKLAQLIFDTLEPHLTVYVEYSNEVWGTLFPGGQYAQAQGVKLGLSPNDPTQARFCYLGLRTNQISTIFRNVFGSSGRLQMVVSTQAVNADTTRRILACQNTSNYVDAVAIAPYLSINLADNMTFANIIQGMTTEITRLGATIRTHVNYTNQYNLALMCYESGQGLLGKTSTQNSLQIGVQTTVEMRQIYLSYMEMLFNNSITLALHFTESGRHTQYGSWGLFQYVDERLNTSSKWLGTNDYFIEQGLVTGVQTYGSCNTDCNGNGICSFGQCICYSDFAGPTCTVGKFVDYKECGYLCTFNQGTCGLTSMVGNNRYYSCTCLPGYTGFYCSIPICSSQCNYNGTCVGPNNCSCFRGRMGANCELDCGCGGHGTCKADQTCQCDAGYVYNATSKKCEFACNGEASALCYGPNLLACPGCASGTCNNGVCACWPGFTGDNCTVQVDVPYVNANLGINVGGLAYWSTQHLFKDYFKQSSQWIPQYYPNYFNSSIQYAWNTSQSFPTLNNGYPSSLYANMSVGKLLLRDLQMHYPSINTTNQYVLLYDGDGVIQLGFDAKITEYSAGRIKFTVIPSTVRDNGVYVRLILTNPNRPLQNIRVILQRDEYNYANDLLTENFITFMSQFSTIRYMDLLGTNGSPVSAWSQATKANMDTQAQPTGISFDLLAKIVRRTGTNAWVNVPHLATDDYVTQMATFLRDNIPLKRTIYVEYSNEVWNTAFQQGKYATAQATALNLTNYHKFYATRSLQIFSIFTTVFGSNSRLKFVIAYQAVSQWVANNILTTSININGTTVTLSSYPNLIVAAAPYYDCNSIGNTVNTAVVATQTASQVIQRCNTSFASLTSLLQVGSSVSGNYSNIPMAAYEAGTSISEYATIFSTSETPAATTTFIAANKDPGMYDVYKTLLYTYKQNNLGVTAPLMLFSSIGLPSKYGSWGLLDYLDQINETPTHPKFQAVLDFNQAK